MIDVRDVMVGDFLRVTKDVCIKKGTIVEVRGCDADNNLPEAGLTGCISCHPLDKNQFTGGVWADYLDPIPLAPQILEKNGWEYKNGIWVKKGPVRLGWYEKKKELIIGYHTMPIIVEFVHTLQHIIRLLGLEEDIVL